ncbi:hypothetical protein BBJ28_00012357 [Nothophytophthora sp. Chile5]|nr:hypothetical protein BBJ28_00012357 [Nothophytophthora sp. Chile5]
MPQTINEPDVDFEAQVWAPQCQEQLHDLELARIHDEPDLMLETPSSSVHGRRKSFRPASAKPRTTTLTSLAEDVEVASTSTSFVGLDAYRVDDGGLPLVSEVFSSSYDEAFSPSNVLMSDSRTLWVSSGMFPQFLRLYLREPRRVAAIEITSRHVKKLQVRAARGRNVARDKMTVVGEMEVSAADSGKLDTHRFALDRCSVNSKRDDDEAKGGDEDEEGEAAIVEALEVIDIDIDSGYGDFVCVYFIRLRLANPKGNTRT